MKIFANRNIWKKIVIVFLFLTVFGFVKPKPVEASIGGVLMDPVCDLLVGLGDGIVNVVHKIILQDDVTTLLKIDFSGTGSIIGKFAVAILAGILVAAAVSAAIYFTGGAILAAATKIGLSVGTMALTGSIVAFSIGAGFYGGYKVYNLDAWTDRVDIPLYSISPEEIFRNEIPLFNVNFFDVDNNKESEEERQPIEMTAEQYVAPTGFTPLGATDNGLGVEKGNAESKIQQIIYNNSPFSLYNFLNNYKAHQFGDDVIDGHTTEFFYLENKDEDSEYKVGTYRLSYEYNKEGYGTFNQYTLQYSDKLGNYSGSKRAATLSDTSNMKSYNNDLAEVVSKWYYRLLVMGIIAMMSVLVYIGIRILLSSVASQKAKYKQMLGDWFVGMLLLFSMHFIMAFSNMFVDKLTEAMGSFNQRIYYHALENKSSNGLENKNGKIEKALQEAGFNVSNDSNLDTTQKENIYKFVDGETGSEYVQIPVPNLMAQLRYDVSYNRENEESYIGYTILYMIMIIYLVLYIFVYLKRLVYMVFLTMIAPLVAITYPIDKVNDGRAQGFDLWFKEYIFNLLIQPLHLLLYTVLISSAITLAIEHPLYAIVVMGFMSPAEKIMRQMFNFQKASTPGVFGGPAGGALVMSGMRWLMGHGPKGGAPENKDKESAPTSTGNRTLNFGSLGGKGSNDIEDGQSANSREATIVDNMQEEQNEHQERGTVSDSRGSNQIGQADTGNNGNDADYSDDDFINDLSSYDEEMRRLNTEDNIQGSSSAENAGESKSDVKPKAINSTSNIDTRSRRRRLWDAMVAGTGTYADGMKGKFARSIKNAKPVSTLGRIGLGAFGAAGLGMVGLAAGASTGDFSKAAQFAGAGVAGGYKLGANRFDATSRALNVEGVTPQIERAYYGEQEYQRRKALERQQEDMQKEEYISLLQQKLKVNGKNLTRKQAKERLQEIIPYYYDNKITTDINEMVKIEKTVEAMKKMEEFKDDPKVRDKAVFGQQMYKQFGVNSTLDKDKREKRVHTVKNYYKDDPNVTETLIRQSFRWADIYTNTNESQ